MESVQWFYCHSHCRHVATSLLEHYTCNYINDGSALIKCPSGTTLAHLNGIYPLIMSSCGCFWQLLSAVVRDGPINRSLWSIQGAQTTVWCQTVRNNVASNDCTLSFFSISTLDLTFLQKEFGLVSYAALLITLMMALFQVGLLVKLASKTEWTTQGPYICTPQWNAFV